MGKPAWLPVPATVTLDPWSSSWSSVP
uniref:Uncharacterized protein n=1 Tax=Anguilla anguilla TaxID=7936 RepID=A0A0E9VLQ3_ANGAN